LFRKRRKKNFRPFPECNYYNKYLTSREEKLWITLTDEVGQSYQVYQVKSSSSYKVTTTIAIVNPVLDELFT